MRTYILPHPFTPKDLYESWDIRHGFNGYMPDGKTVFTPSEFSSLFDRFFESVGAEFRNIKAYPPMNVSFCNREKENFYLLELAVAGYVRDGLDVRVDRRKGHLVITGKTEHRKLPENWKPIHTGLSRRDFEIRLKLSDYMEVGKTELKDGILSVRVDVNLPEEKDPEVIEIT